MAPARLVRLGLALCGVAAALGAQAAAQQFSAGCKDPAASNYWPTAPATDNSMCVYAQQRTGCTDENADNYDPKATQDDGSCRYTANNPINPAWCDTQAPDGQFYSSTCRCSSAGLKVPYGRWCAKGYSGCPGSQACDDLDACCQEHDWCVGQKGFLECYCNARLAACARAFLHRVDTNGFCGLGATAANTIVSDLAPMVVCPCDDLSDTDCYSCTSDSCNFCPSDGTCHSKLNPFASCSSPLVTSSDQCAAAPRRAYHPMFLQDYKAAGKLRHLHGGPAVANA